MSKRIELVFGTRVTTEDNVCISGGPGALKERERWVLDLKLPAGCYLFAVSNTGLPLSHGGPSQQLSMPILRGSCVDLNSSDLSCAPYFFEALKLLIWCRFFYEIYAIYMRISYLYI